MMGKYFLLVCTLILIFFSCDRDLMNRKASEEEFSLKGLLDSLHIKVHASDPLLFKKAIIDGQLDSAELKLDSASQWSREFQIFNDLKIQPDRLNARYTKSIAHGEKQITKYFAKDPKNATLDSIFIFRDGSKLKGLQAFVNYSNTLNATQQFLEIRFKESGGEILPTDYEIKGWQKMTLKDTVHFTIQSELRYPTH